MTNTAQADRAPADLRRTAKLLNESRLLMEPRQREILRTLPEDVRRCVGFHIGWWEADGRTSTARQGKAIRPALTFACARAIGANPVDAVPAAIAVELLHDSSLLHDDIMDGDVTRRHRPAAWVAYGTPLALLTGDTLLVLALDLIHTGPSGAALRSAALELCSGQSADLAFEGRAAVRLPECLRMAEQKTGALLGAACELGALSGGGETKLAGKYREFGRHLGLAFQLVDDILGIWGRESKTGKPVYSDLRSRKKTLPIAAALSSATPAGEELAAVLSSEDLHDDVLAHAATLIEVAGGRSWAQAEAVRHRTLALDALAAAQPDPNAAGDLRALADLITTRDW